MSQGWKKGKERSYALLVKCLLLTARLLGRPLSRRCLYFISFYFWIFTWRSRQASLDYLDRALGRKARHWDVFRHYHVFASVLLDRIFLLGDWQKYLSVKTHGESVLKEIHKKGGGCLLLGAHLGSFEIARTLGLEEEGIAIKVLMYEENESTSNKVFYEANPEAGNTVISMGSPLSLLKVKELVDAGYMVAILGDRVFNENKKTQCRFFGDMASFPTGPIIMASVFKIPVVLFFGIYKGGNRYDIFFEKLADRILLNRDCRDHDIQAWTQKFAERLEFYVRLAPFNWFNFYDFWEDRK